MTALSRRALVIGGLGGGLAVAAGVLVYRRWRDYARHADEVRADYLAGRVAVVAGWIMSETEAGQVVPSVGSSRPATPDVDARPPQD